MRVRASALLFILLFSTTCIKSFSLLADCEEYIIKCIFLIIFIFIYILMPKAVELAAILSRKNNCEYKVLIDLSCADVVNDRKPFQK